MNNIKIINTYEFVEESVLSSDNNLLGQTGDDYYLVEYQVEFSVLAYDKEFLVIFQSEERNDSMKAYCQYGVASGINYGCDADESYKLELYLDEIKEGLGEEVGSFLNKEARKLAKFHFDYLTSEMETNNEG